VLALLVRCGLLPGRRAVLPAPGVTDDRFVLVARLDGAARGAGDLRDLFRAHGAVQVDERIGAEES